MKSVIAILVIAGTVFFFIGYLLNSLSNNLMLKIYKNKNDFSDVLKNKSSLNVIVLLASALMLVIFGINGIELFLFCCLSAICFFVISGVVSSLVYRFSVNRYENNQEKHKSLIIKFFISDTIPGFAISCLGVLGLFFMSLNSADNMTTTHPDESGLLFILIIAAVLPCAAFFSGIGSILASRKFVIKLLDKNLL